MLLDAVWGIKNFDCYRSDIIDLFYQQLNILPSYLLIFDDAENYQTLISYLPKQQIGKRQHILITSRSQHWEKIISVNTFTQQESAYFISQKLPNESKQQVIKLAQQLGHLPLALSQAIAYIKSTAIDINNYLIAYVETPKDILNAAVLLDLFETTYTSSIYKTFCISLEKLKQKDNKAVDLLKYCAYLHPEKITRNLIKNIINSEHEINQSIAILRNYSLIEISEDKSFFNIHCLTQIVMHFILKEENLDAKIILLWLKKLHEKYEYDRNKPALFKEYLVFSSHVASLLKHAEKYNIIRSSYMSKLYINVLSSLAMYQLFEKHEYNFSQNRLFKVLELCHVHKIKIEKSTLAKIYNAIGFSYFRKEESDLNKGASFFKKTLKLYKKQNNAHISFALHGLGCIYYREETYDKAIKYLEKALNMIQKIYNDDKHIDIALCLSSLGKCYYTTTQFKKAKFVCLKAIEIGHLISTDGFNFDVADSYHTLSIILQADNKNKPTQDSVNYFQKSLDIYKKLLDSPYHQDIIKVENQLARAKALLKEGAKKLIFSIIAGNVEIKLSHREIQCLFFLTKGMSAKQTAYALYLSQRTVETYLNQLKKKLKCRTKLQLLSALSKENIIKIEKYLFPQQD